MRALPVRLVAPGVLCAALLTGVTGVAGPAASAADTAPERHRATSSAALLEQVEAVDADEHGLTPVVDLLKAALEADGARLSSAEVRKLGDAAKDALAKAAADDPAATTATTAPAEPSSSATSTNDTVVTVVGDDLTDEDLTTLREAVDNLLELLLSGTTTSTDTATDADAATGTEAATETDADTNATQAPSLIGDLLGRAEKLVAALLGTGTTQATTLPAPAGLVRAPILPGLALPGVTLPGVAPLTSLLMPA
ncbi:hypothetical protein AB0D84_15850 [Streptomyces sp. NPDC048193]|uniref:hypothetical protein n=1 Tax=unclassified Streptomyces TaxID=2593676 RepID=UPI0034417668